MTVVPHTWSGTPSTATRPHDAAAHRCTALLDVGKINLVASGDHDVVHPAQNHQFSGFPVPAVLGAKPAVHDSLRREIWTQPIASEERRNS